MEDDRFGQYPFLYVILGYDKCILIDTGCGKVKWNLIVNNTRFLGGANYREFVTNNINRQNLPYFVINTHVHFDHIGGNNNFSNCPICMGNNNTAFTNNYEINSLAAAHSGAQIKVRTSFYNNINPNIIISLLLLPTGYLKGVMFKL